MLICPVLMLVLLSFSASAADLSSLTVKVVGETCVVTACDKKAEGELVIPSEIGGKTASIIGSGAFSGCKNLTKIILPDTLIEISDSAFSGCTGLVELTLPKDVVRLGESAFSQCTSLRYISLSAGITTILKNTFYMCSSLEEINLPEKLKVISDNAFFGCGGLKKLILPEETVSVLTRSFSSCSSLESIYLPSSLELVGADAFEKCEALNTVYYGDSQKAFDSLTVLDGNGYFETAELIFNHDHINSAVVTAVNPDCTQEGYSIYNCPCGFVSQGAVESALGHSLTVRQVVTEPTCESKGTEKHKCERCEYYELKVISATGHKTVYDNAVKATCIDSGKTAGSHCSVCGKTLVNQVATLPLGHDFSIKTKDKNHLAVKATYKSADKYYYSCSRCSEMSKDKTFEGEKLVLPKVKKLSFSSTASSVTLKWSKVSTARGYGVYKKDKKGNWSLIKRVKANSVKLEKLPSGTVADYAVRAYVKEGESLVYSPEYTSVKTVTKPLATSKITAKQNDKAVTLSWKKSKGATGYRVYRYDSSSKKWKTVCSYTRKNKFTLKGLQSGRKYKFSVRTCVKIGDKLVWSERSDSITTCTKPSSPVLKSSAYKYSIKLSWNKIKYADGYTVYVSTNPNSGYKKVKSTKKTSLKIENLNSKKTYYFKVYSYRNLSDSKVNSYASQIKKVKTR